MLNKKVGYGSSQWRFWRPGGFPAWLDCGSCSVVFAVLSILLSLRVTFGLKPTSLVKLRWSNATRASYFLIHIGSKKRGGTTPHCHCTKVFSQPRTIFSHKEGNMEAGPPSDLGDRSISTTPWLLCNREGKGEFPKEDLSSIRKVLRG